MTDPATGPDENRPRHPSSRAASTALFLGIVAVVSAAVVVGGFIGIAAILLGKKAARAIDQSERRIPGRPMAAGGIVLGWLSIPIAAVALAWIVLTPRLAGSRGMEAKVQTLNQMRQIARACLMYAADNNDHFPPHFAAAIGNYGITPAMLRDPRSGQLPAVLPPAATNPGRDDWQSLAHDIDAHCDFVYLAAGLRQQDFDNPEAILFYAKILAGSKHLIACSDGRAEEVDDSDFQILLSATNAAREKHGLKPLTLPR